MMTKDDFKNRIAEIEKGAGYRKPLAFGICRLQKGQLNTDKILTCSFPVVNWNENFGSAAILIDALGVDCSAETVCEITPAALAKMEEAFAPFMEEASGDAHRNVRVIQNLKGKDLSDFRAVFLFDDSKVQSLPAAYLKLSAMSLRKVRPRTINLDGVFGLLENVAWVGNTAYEIAYLKEKEIALKMAGEYPAIDFVDKFPRYLQQVVPEMSSRILETSRVRFGAYIGEGTTLMPGASYVNFNAGTEGPAMVEGRISSSAFVGAGSDVGGGASILGVLSGGNADPISIGKDCLLGANSVTGISLGDSCIVDAGVTILAGTKIAISDKDQAALQSVNPGVSLASLSKGESLSGLNGLHIRLDSQTGQMIARRSTREVALNEELHGKKRA